MNRISINLDSEQIEQHLNQTILLKLNRIQNINTWKCMLCI